MLKGEGPKKKKKKKKGYYDTLLILQSSLTHSRIQNSLLGLNLHPNLNPYPTSYQNIINLQ